MTTAVTPSGDASNPRGQGPAQAVAAGIVAPIVGFASTFALVLAGSRAVGATPQQAASGLLATCVLMGAVAIWLALRYRMPIGIAWSTPGAALLISSGEVSGGYPAALGAFVVCGALIVAVAMWRSLGRLLAAIPAPLGSAMLAGVLLPVCLTPVEAAVALPGMALPGIVTWAAVTLVDRRWAVPASLVVTAIAIAIDPVEGARAPVGLAPALEFTAPAFDPAAIIGLALPLFVVTMASQNLTGMVVLASFGYRPPLRPILLSTGAGTSTGAFFGAQVINLAAITQAMVAGPDAGADTSRRWIAGVTSGGAYLVLGLCAGLATALVAAAPPLLIEAIAGLALLGALAASLRAALEEEPEREAAIVTFVISASAVTIWGISAPFWALLVGGVLVVARRRVRPVG